MAVPMLLILRLVQRRARVWVPWRAKRIQDYLRKITRNDVRSNNTHVYSKQHFNRRAKVHTSIVNSDSTAKEEDSASPCMCNCGACAVAH